MKTRVALALFLAVQFPAFADEPAKCWERVAVIGASASSGHGVSRLQGKEIVDVALADVCDSMILEKHETVRSFASEMFFLGAEEEGKKQVEKATGLKPTAVLAIDYLFWFGYGEKPEEQRLKDLETGFRFLETFTCPVVVSEIADMSEAVGKGLSKDMVPSKDAIEKLNARIREWAGTRKNVIVVPLREICAAAIAEKPVQAGASEWKEKPRRILLQKDDLHPTLEGLAMVAALCLDALKQKEKVGDKVFNLDAKAVASKLKMGGNDEPEEPKK